MSFHQGDPKADEKQYALPIKKMKGSTNRNGAKENPSGRRQRHSPATPKS